jgi:type IV pilus assembly protein PilQ
MITKRSFWGILFLLTFFNSTLVHAQEDQVINPDLEVVSILEDIVDSSLTTLNFETLPSAVFADVENINVNGASAVDFFRAIGRQYNVNLIIDNSLDANISVRFSEISLIEVMVLVCQENNFLLEQTGNVFRVKPKVIEETVVEVPQKITLADGSLTIDVNEYEIQEFARHLSEVAGINVMVRSGVRGFISGFLRQVELLSGLENILANNGYSLRQNGGIYIIDRRNMSYQGQEDTIQNFWVQYTNGLISLDVVNASVSDLIREIGYQSEINMITYGLPTNSITAKVTDLTIDETLNYIFRSTDFTFRKEGEMYIIGDKNTSGIATSRLIRLDHLRSDVILELLPEEVRRNASLQVIREQNGIMIIATSDIIAEVEAFIKEIDYPTPQIMIEALVVDVNTSDMYQLGTTLASGGAPDSSFFNPFTVLFGQGENQTGGLAVQGSGIDVNAAFSPGGNLFGVRNLGRLPRDFFFRIQALDQEGLVTVQSRPQISTLNGHTASIEIGTTQYYIFTTTTPLQSPNQIVTQESQQFEEIEANVRLEITPWVSASGEVTVEITPEFNTPVGAFSPDIPPTINSRVLDSTVRLKDGETIILGGLIQESESENINKVPILGSIPLLGRLFRNKSTSQTKSELVVFVTPYVFYGDGSDPERWNQIRQELDLSIDE